MTNDAPNHIGNGDIKKKLPIILIIAAAIVIILIIGISIGKKRSPSAPPIGPGATSTPIIAPEEPKEKPKTIETPLGEFDVKQPEQTAPLAPEKIEEVAKKSNVITITIRANDFSPKEFAAEAGRNVSLLFQSIDSIYVFRFEDTVLANIRMSALPEETRGLSFIAPAKIGDYVFFVEKMGFEGTGKRGVMHVR